MLPVSSTGSFANTTELEQRVAYMEKLVTHYTGVVNLDCETLQNLVMSVGKQPDLQGSNASVYLGVDDEKFTVQPLGNNITRKTRHLMGL